MSSTQTSTIPMPSKEEYTSIDRVAQIPMIHSCLDAFISAVNANSYTRAGFGTAKDLSSSVYKYAEPYQTRFSPILLRADGYANKTIDVAQEKFPAAFQAKPEDVAEYVRGHTRSASDFVTTRRDSITKAIDVRVKTPAIAVVTGVDKGCTKLVDALEVVVSKTSDGKPAVPETQYQYQRAFALSKHLKDNVYGYSAEQWKAIQEQNKLVQAATVTAHSITQAASSAQDQVKELSNKMIAELHRLQASTNALINSLQSTASNTVQTSTSQLQNQTAYIQRRWSEASEAMVSPLNDLQIIAKEDASIQEKVTKIARLIQEHITPALEEMRTGFFSRTSSPTQEHKPQMNGVH